MSTRRQFLSLGLWALAPAVAPGLLSGCSAGPRRLRIAAGDEGGIYVAFARLLAARLERRVDGLQVEVHITDGTQENYDRLARGEADLGLGLADSVAAAAQGDRGERVRALARIYENYLQLVVAADGPVRTVTDLAGRRATLGAAGSGAAVTGAVLLRAAGLGTDGPRGVHVRHSGLATSLDELQRGETDAVLWSGGIPTPILSEVDARFPLRMLDLGGLVPAMATLSGYPYVERRVPRVSYAPERLGVTVGVPNFLLARSGLPQQTAQTVVEVLAEDSARLMPEFVLGLQYLTPGLMIQTSPVRLHAGAVAAYRRLHG
ncbi:MULTISPECIES: TAXI family TRAP transporter solute-binding subunit [Nocardioides]|uniref:TAXI family TRAP transporter solute-binding subunit n=1 Tax=Nocardioides vastitatis TaxID=2568655 RepID=A0ABW0ZKY6_9ACTN|nr:TAXI family TRAP transporter solute-binding subunit [Nocardioides sp.]THJ02057.1 TAXI family TRAP transporter solute-binding subunit [Nocardioides sp.]